MLTSALTISAVHWCKASQGELIGTRVDWWMNRNETSWDFLFPVELEEEVELIWADRWQNRRNTLNCWELSDSKIPAQIDN